MPISFNTMVTTISGELNMGTRYDAQIPAKLRQAVRKFERKLDFPYMREFVGIEVSAGDTTVDLIDFAPIDIVLLKKILFWRLEDSYGQFSYIKSVEPQDFRSVDDLGIPPSSYFINYPEELVYVDREFNETYEAEKSRALVVSFTDPDTLVAGLASHWLFDNAEQAIIAQTILNLGPTMREPEMMVTYGKLLETEWDDLCQYVEEFDAENADMVMNPFRKFAAT